MMDWDKLRIFHTVAQAGSFTKAAERMNVSQSAISRQINALEESLGIPLFHRHTRGLMLTTQGDLLFQSAKEVFAKLALTEALMNESRGNSYGALKVASSVAFGSMWIVPHLKEFMSLYPHMRLNLLLRDDEDEVDLNMREADINISCQQPTQSDLIATPLPPLKLRIYASRTYLEKNGVPLKISDLDTHDLIVYGHETPHQMTKSNVILHAGAKCGTMREPYLMINNVYGILQSVKASLGMAVLNRYIVKDEPDLVEILPEYDLGYIQNYIIYPEQLKTSKRVSAFRDFIIHKAKESRTYS